MPKWQGTGRAPLIPWVKSCSLGPAPRYRARRQLLSPRSVSGCPVVVPLVTMVLGGRGFLGDFSAAAGKLFFFFFFCCPNTQGGDFGDGDEGGSGNGGGGGVILSLKGVEFPGLVYSGAAELTGTAKGGVKSNRPPPGGYRRATNPHRQPR